MANTEETRAAAREALRTYVFRSRKNVGQDHDEFLVDIQDLITNLAQLADAESASPDSGEWVLAQASFHFREEKAEQSGEADDEERPCGCGGYHAVCPADEDDFGDSQLPAQFDHPRW